VDRGIMNAMPRDAIDGPWLLEPARRHYAWGSRRLIPELLGETVDGEPLAELWFGAHPTGSAVVPAKAGAALVDLVRSQPHDVLGDGVARWFGELPFMVKLIAAAQPLSIQVHPDAARAVTGFAEDNARGLAAGDPNRRYQDGRGKPEIVCALGEFDALIDFRSMADIVSHLESAGVDDVAAAVSDGGLAAGVRMVLSASFETAHGWITSLVSAGDDIAATLAKAYPGDPGVIVATFLNHVRLMPGDAAFLAPGSVHAYLSGLAVEVMATSDNVLRAGLTSKLVDIEEFLQVARIESADPDLLQPSADGRYPARAAEFALARHTGEEQTVNGPAVVVCTGGDLQVGALAVAAGHAAFVPAAAPGAAVSGSGDGFVATVGQAG
jgi:mannose-6-phosphate isomerase